jgi:hypothetical protein
MRKLLRKLIQILDGTSTEYGKRQSGQSLVELALVTPILIVLLSGMVEIGWFANNYLTLLDVTRAGARRAATLQSTSSALVWDNRGSYMPTQMLPPDFVAQRIGFMPYSSNSLEADRQEYERTVHRPTVGLTYSGDGSGCSIYGFYNDVACTMVNTLKPLFLNPENGVDDVIVSAFSLELVNPAEDSTGSYANQAWLGSNRPIAGDVPQMVVVGRYPTNANECDAVETAQGSGDFRGAMDPRDPFDFNENLLIDRWTDTLSDPTVVYPYVWNDDFSELYPGYDINEVDLDQREKQVGFVWLGQHRTVAQQPDGSTRQTLCLGSEWSIADVEQMLNLTSYVPVAATPERELLSGTGLVLAEIYWQHEMLLKLPVFNPVYNLLSQDGMPPTIYIWAAFPLPSTAPSIVFH